MITIDNSRFEELHIVKRIRETLRNWWKLEFVFADQDGNIVDEHEVRVTNSHNDICRTSLLSEIGIGLCQQSVNDALMDVRDRKQVVSKIVFACHLGFPILVVPVVSQGNFYGGLIIGGFLIDGHELASTRQVREAAEKSEVSLGDLQSNLQTVPILDGRDLVYLRDLMEITVEEVIEYLSTLERHEEQLKRLTGEVADKFSFGNLIGRSKPMRRLFGLLNRVSGSDATVLITGENGTGKELVARGLHYNGPRREKAFVVQNVTALNDNLLESELFGHVRGAFTGAVRDKKGLFEVADGGTFFLDEVGDMSPTMQVKMLRVLQEGTFLPVGATESKHVDVRVVTATNKDLRKRVQEGFFREDLYYRLNVINIHIPPLRERREDIPALVDHFLAKLAEKERNHGGPARGKRMSREVMARFYEHPWPGNVRELENEVERLWVLAGEETVVGPELLALAQPSGHNAGFAAKHIRTEGTMESAVNALEREMVTEALRSEHGNRTRVAKRLGMSRTTLIRKIKEYGLERIGHD